MHGHVYVKKAKLRIQRHVHMNNPNVLSQPHNVKVFYVNFVSNFKNVISNIRKSLFLNSNAESRSSLADLY
jgi:hypothetical protein